MTAVGSGLTAVQAPDRFPSSVSFAPAVRFLFGESRSALDSPPERGAAAGGAERWSRLPGGHWEWCLTPCGGQDLRNHSLFTQSLQCVTFDLVCVGTEVL